MSSSYEVKIRPECFLPADEGWQRPSGPEVQEIVRRVGMSGRGVARLLGLSEHGGRQVRRWMSEEAPIPYSAWAILCDIAGFERIWLDAEMRIVPERTDPGEDSDD